MRPILRLWCLVALLLVLIGAASAQKPGDAADGIHIGRRPRLVVVVSIDQFRADYLRRLVDLYLPPKTNDRVGGFRYLMATGSDYLDARYAHFPLYTGPGHAVQLTGSYPYKNGIVSNDWWDRDAAAPVYCVDDPRYKVVGAAPTSKTTPMGPLNLKVSTVGDEMKLATNGRSKTVSISLKDRAAILMSGHMTDVCLWFDTDGGRWISSTAYAKDGKLPSWVEDLNREALPDKTLGKTWEPFLIAPILAQRSFPPHLAAGANPGNIGLRFPHTIGSEKIAANYVGFTHTPFANAFVFETAKRAIKAEQLGQDETPDLLTINLATNDYIGHAFGPYSPEAVDLAVQTDALLSDFLNFINRTVPGGLKETIFVVTADHGGDPVPEDMVDRNILPNLPPTPGRLTTAAIGPAIQKALAAHYGDDTWLATSADGKKNGAFMENFSYLSDAAIAKALESGKAKTRAEIERTAADAVEALKLPGIYAVYTRSQILARELPDTDMARRIANGCHPKLSGDLFIIDNPYYIAGANAASHGTPYAYDTQVPLLISGFGIAAGTFAEPVSPADLAPTLSILLGTVFPSGSDGVILKSALR